MTAPAPVASQQAATDTETRTRRTKLVIALIGTALVTAYATVAALQILVWNPLAAAPGLTLAEIRAEMAAAGESVNEPWVLGILGLGVLLAGLLLVLTAPRSDLTPRGLAVAYAAMIGMGAIGCWVAAFQPGMALADTFMISGADHAPGAGVLYVISAVAIIVAIALTVKRSGAASAPETTGIG